MVVSKLVFGTGGRFGRPSHDLAFELFSFCLDSGVYAFDTGIAYGGGRSLDLLFKCLSKHKIVDIDCLFIFTNVDSSLSPESIYPSVLSALRGLPMRSFIDVLFLWGPSR